MTEEGTAPQKPARKTVGPMTVRIGKWSDDGATFTSLVSLIGPTDKEIKQAVQKLGYGTYDLITGRDTKAVLAKKETDSFTL